MHDPLHPQEHPNFTKTAIEVDLRRLLSIQPYWFFSLISVGNLQQTAMIGNLGAAVWSRFDPSPGGLDWTRRHDSLRSYLDRT
jgi:hypothetical protein